QVAGYVTGTTAHVTNCATSCYFSGKTIEQFPVKWLVLKLIEDSECILIGNAIVTFAYRLCGVVVHSISRWWHESAGRYSLIYLRGPLNNGTRNAAEPFQFSRWRSSPGRKPWANLVRFTSFIATWIRSGSAFTLWWH